MQEETHQTETQQVVNQEITNDTTGNQQLTYTKNIFKFLYQIWWRVQFSGFDCLPDNGPALIAGNTSGQIPWPALMLIYSFMENKKKNRTVYTLVNSDFIENNKLDLYLKDLNFIPWSYDNAKELLEKGEIVAIFPEDNKIIAKTKGSQNRTKRFDWTKFLPAVELHVPIHPLATLGVDESSLINLPVPWKMKIMPSLSYALATNREDIQEKAKKIALRAEGDIQAEINRMLRSRKSFI